MVCSICTRAARNNEWLQILQKDERQMRKTAKTACLLIVLVVLTICVSPLHGVSCAEEYRVSTIIVSLGDSYSAGEGIPPFYRSDLSISEEDDPDWIARRSTLSWPGRLKLENVSGSMSDHRNTNWFFAAATGATINNLYSAQEFKIRRKTRKSFLLPAQFSVFNKLKRGEKADYITITIGGNDVGFANIIGQAARFKTVLDGNALNDRIDDIKSHFYDRNGIADKLKKAYSDIAERAGDQAAIIVAGYPPLLSEEGSILFDQDSSQAINRAVTWFNNVIRMLVNECYEEGMNIYFVSVEEAFQTHEAYTEEPYLNMVLPVQSEDLNQDPLTFSGKGESEFSLINALFPLTLFLEGKVSPNFISTYSIHPNKEGARVYAECVQEEIDRLEELKKQGKGRWENPVPAEEEEKEEALYSWEDLVPAPVKNPANGHRYDIFGNVDTWEEANQYCRKFGGHLATITSREENDFVYYNVLLNSGNDSAYIGLTDAKLEGIWEWCTGEPLIYTNWADGEPNHENQNEDYAMFYYKFTDGKWNDGDFGNQTVNDSCAFICEWDLDPETEDGQDYEDTAGSPEEMYARENQIPDKWEEEQYQYDILEDGSAAIWDYHGYGGNLIIPGTLGGRKVSGIRDGAFSMCLNLATVAIPDSITSIEGNPFAFCGELTGIYTSPDNETFSVTDGVLFSRTDKRLICYPRGCASRSYTIPDGTRIIGDNAFSFSALTDIVIPDSVTWISDYAFADCKSLVAVVSENSYAEEYCKKNQIKYIYP